ncbi:lysozyme inhibitor LprI family protein [Pantoea cypripedii]|uniref:Lysozyme inhibitor LprI-like N-terminal domain-containing protein n=1 Tax=Pantoea cypripedii TaxID=55209 RepID=A0A6B9FXW4_PANCY|nr:lysozyme inhibitor LprI family protein [Pantoea cypripedii]QGY29524.1 hypothetical protein CUN67_11515 [Pantoea cypripedii]
MKRTLLAALLLGSVPAAYSASFDCNKATGFVELTICATPELSTLDTQLSTLYNSALQQQPQNKALLRKTQLAWLKDIRNKATTIQALESAYQGRIRDLTTLTGTQAPSSSPTPTPAPAPAPPAADKPAAAPAKSPLELKAESGDVAAQTELGIQLSQGTPAQQRTALTWLEPAAKAGNTAAMAHLGYLLTFGEGVTKDIPRGMQLTRQAAEANNADAQIDLGYSYAKGVGVPLDLQQSLFWYEKAGQNGSPLAARNIQAIKYKIAQQEKYQDGFTAILTCGPVVIPNYVDNCFNDSDLKITQNNITTLYNMNSGNYPSQAGEQKSDGLHILLTKNFALFAQNSMDSDVLTIKIINNNTGDVVFQDQAAKYGVIRVRN